MTQPDVGPRDPARPRVAIVGLGFMGGSLAAALRRRRIHVIGAATEVDLLEDDVARSLVDVVSALPDAVAAADIVVLAAPVATIEAQARPVFEACSSGSIVTDIGSVQAPIVAAFAAAPTGVSAVAGHPMCGRATPGRSHADPDVYRGARWFLTPQPGDEVPSSLLAMIDAAGAGPEVVDADVHDTAVALTSHVPVILGRALLDIAAASGIDPQRWGAGGWDGATRVARGGSPQMWADILHANRGDVSDIIDGVEQRLHALRDGLEDPELLVRLLAAGR